VIFNIRGKIFNACLASVCIILLGCENSKNSENSNLTADKIINSEPQFKIGTKALDFSLPDLNGELVNLNSLKGNYVIIHFATTWCPFCNAEAPYLEKMYKEYASRGVKVLLIDVKEPIELVEEKLQGKFNFTFPVLLDLDGSVAASYCPPEVTPDLARDEVMIASNLLIDREGKIQFFSLLDSEGFDAKLTELKARLNELLSSG